jgi:hypothetical protein
VGVTVFEVIAEYIKYQIPRLEMATGNQKSAISGVSRR